MIAFSVIGTIIYLNRIEDGGDQSLVKMMRLSQLIIEFLIHSQETLISERIQMELEIKSLKSGVERSGVALDNAAKDELRKEVKALKKTVLMYELSTRMTAPKAQEYHSCLKCSKAFASEGYLSSHMERRHGGEAEIRKDERKVTKVDEPREETKELKKMVELIETLTTSLKTTPTLGTDGNVLEKLESRLLQERLTFDTELKAMRTTLHRELEDERALLREERAAFERLVISSSKPSGHLGEVEEDGGSSIVDIEDNNGEEAMRAMELRFGRELEGVANRIRGENAINARRFEEKLAEAAEEIGVLRGKENENFRRRESTERKENHGRREIQERIDRKENLEKRELDERGQNIRKDDPPLPVKLQIIKGAAPEKEKAMCAKKRETWKEFVEIMRLHSKMPNPHAKWALSKHHHSAGSIENQKSLVNLELDGFLAQRGITEISIAKLSTDPTLKIITSQVSDYIAAQRIASSHVDFYDEMRTYLDSQVENAISVAYGNEAISPTVNLPRRSSLRKSMLGSTSPTKTVKILDFKPEKVASPAVPKKDGAKLRGLVVSIPKEGSPSSPEFPSSYSAGSLNQSPIKLALSYTAKTADSVKSAFTSIARSFTSPSRQKPFEEAMSRAPFSPPRDAPELPSRKVKKYMDIPMEMGESEKSESSVNRTTGKKFRFTIATHSSTSESEDDETTTKDEVSVAVISEAKTGTTTTHSDISSFEVSEASEVSPVRKILNFKTPIIEDDIDSFDRSSSSPPRVAAHHVNTSHLTDDEDVMAFLDEIDASIDLGASSHVTIDDLADFDD